MNIKDSSPRMQRGITLIELMVGLTIGLFISLAAATLYLTTQDTARTTRSFSDINETGKFVLDTLGRELEKAGFYPAEFETTLSGVVASERQVGQYINIKNPTSGNHVAFDQGLYGCVGAAFDPSAQGCPSPSNGAPDSIVINYFSSTEFGTSAVIGNSNDCNRKAVSGDSVNTARAAAGSPLFVSNRYAVVSQTQAQPNGSSITTKYLGCQGNGNESDTGYKPMVQGLDDMFISYGVFGTTGVQSPSQFMDARAVSTASAWSRISAVRVCVVVRSLANARLEDKSGSERLKPSCRGGTTALPATDRYLYKRFEQVFAIRNNLTGLL